MSSKGIRSVRTAFMAVMVLALSAAMVLAASINSYVLAAWTWAEKVAVSWAYISAGDAQTVALKSDGTIVVWGNDALGQVSNAPAGDGFVAVSTGGWDALALHEDGSLVAWGNNSDGQVSNTPAGNDFVAIGSGGCHNIALKENGSIAAWGWNNYGQATAPAGNDFTTISAGSHHNLALRSDGTIAAWGADWAGQVSNTPAGTYTSIAAGEEHSLALTPTGGIVGWGSDSNGKVSGAPSTNDFVALSAGYEHSLGLRANGSLVGWGSNSYGETTVPVGNDFVAIEAGFYYSIALRDDGTVVTWGGSVSGDITVPEPNEGFGYYPEQEPPAVLVSDDIAIWLEVEPTLITRLERCETFGLIMTGVRSTLWTNQDVGDPYTETAWPEYSQGTYGQPLETDNPDPYNLAQQGPGVLRQDNSPLKTENIDYNVAGNVSFNTDVFADDDFQQIDVVPGATVPITRLSIQRHLSAGGGYIAFGGLAFANRIRTMTDQDPTINENGLDFGLDLELDLPDNTPPGMYQTTLIFVTYQN